MLLVSRAADAVSDRIRIRTHTHSATRRRPRPVAMPSVNDGAGWLRARFADPRPPAAAVTKTCLDSSCITQKWTVTP